VIATLFLSSRVHLLPGQLVHVYPYTHDLFGWYVATVICSARDGLHTKLTLIQPDGRDSNVLDVTEIK
jgi:hypothetical protein